MALENLTTTTEVDPGVSIFYDRVLLKRAQPFLIHEKAAQTRNVNKKSGDTIKFRRYASLTPATTPLTEGVTPPGQKASKTDLTAKLNQYGDYLHVTDWVDITNQDSTLTEFAEILGEQMGKTRDALCRDILAATASAIDVGGTALATGDLDTAIKTLVTNDAQFITTMVKAGTGQATVPVSPAYWAMAHAELIDDISGLTGWIPVRKYARQDDVQDAEWGAYEQIRFLFSSQGYKDSTASPYKIPVIGKNAYAVTEIEGGAAKNIVKAFGSGGTSDPLNQRATSGWKMTYVARILNDNFMLKLDNISHS